jgi:two-component system, chemotaxis family, CheB/CheR fusion protein
MSAGAGGIDDNSTDPGSDRAQKAGPEGPTVVGIGASAGGLDALRRFFSDLPERTGLAYVVVVHLHPEHESHLAELLQPAVSFPVQQVTETLALEPDQVYVIPPNRNLDTIDTHLRVTALEEDRRRRAPIDHFFRGLAGTHDGHAVAVVLTGTGSDGALGIKEIKERGGLAIVQDPADAEYDGMPQSAIATGSVDLVLPLADIPDAILRFAGTKPEIEVPAEGEGLTGEETKQLQRVFAQIRARTHRDFSQYKASTIMRRLRRRMQLRHVEALSGYLDLLRADPDEVRELADDLLLTVSSFFRDPEVFQHLERQVVPALFEGKRAGDRLRVWSVGCATGEEAYSLAMLLVEEAERRDDPPQVQIFASDLHEQSLQRGRDGFYPGDIETDVSPERLARFFRREDGGYRVRKELRELVVFAPHNLLSDPPFSRLDLVACRNVLIYLQREVQRDVVQVFHYALDSGGWLVLGSSEVVETGDLFVPEHRKRCTFRKRDVDAAESRLPVFPLTRSRIPRSLDDQRSRVPAGYSRIHQRLLETHAPPSLLVTPDDRVVHLSASAGRYLVQPGGELTDDVFKLVRTELTMELRAGLQQARNDGCPWRSKPVTVHTEQPEQIVLDVRPSTVRDEENFCLVVLERVHEPASRETGIDAEPAEMDETTAALASRVRRTESERDLAHQRLQATIEEYETSQEELKASNEELQSANEELRSTLEELETSREELQSMNEELQTVNQENRHKVEELAQLSSDLQNLLAATDIATLFLDRELRILRFTPRVSELFNVRSTDRARPISDLTHRLGYDDLAEDAAEVLRTLIPIEREIHDDGGRWYLTRLLAYRSAEDRIEGVVITFVDITSRKQSEERLQRSEQALQDANETLEQRVEAAIHQIRELVSSLTGAEQDERRRISGVLHDDIQQHLYSIQMKLGFAREETVAGDLDEAAHEIRDAEERLETAIELTRTLSVELSPPLLESDGLIEALSWLVSHMADLHDLHVELRADGEPAHVDPDLRVFLFQAAKELLFNVAKHAGTDRAVLDVGQSAHDVWLRISDDGVGFDLPALEANDGEGYGLSNVRGRLRLLGGDLELDTAPGDGTRVRVRLPTGGAR